MSIYPDDVNAVYPDKVTKQFIRSTFVLDGFRQKVSYKTFIDTLEDFLDLEPDKDYTIAEFLSRVEATAILSHADGIKFSYGGEFQLYKIKHKRESDDEVVTRLQGELLKEKQQHVAELKERAEYERLKAKFEG